VRADVKGCEWLVMSGQQTEAYFKREWLANTTLEHSPRNNEK